MLKVAYNLTERAVLCEMETAPPNGGVPDMRGEMLLPFHQHVPVPTHLGCSRVDRMASLQENTPATPLRWSANSWPSLNTSSRERRWLMPSSGFCRTTIRSASLPTSTVPRPPRPGHSFAHGAVGDTPLNLLLLWFNFRRHHNPLGLLVAGPGAVFIVMVVTSHWLDAIPHDLIWPGLALVAAGVLIDCRSQWQRQPLLRTG